MRDRRLERGHNNNYTPSDRGSPNGCRKSAAGRVRFCAVVGTLCGNARGVSDAPCERAFEEGLNGSACGRETGGRPAPWETDRVPTRRFRPRGHAGTRGRTPRLRDSCRRWLDFGILAEDGAHLRGKRADPATDLVAHDGIIALP